MDAVTPGETLGTLYNIHVGSNKTKQLKGICSPKSDEQGQGRKTSRGVMKHVGQSMCSLYNVFSIECVLYSTQNCSRRGEACGT